MHILSELDSFSVPIRMRSGQNRKSFKSPFGGVMTLAMYTLSFGYCVSVLIQWHTGCLPPTSQTTQAGVTAQEFMVENETIQIAFFNQTTQQTEPMNENGNIITPLLIKINDKVMTNTGPLFSDQSLNYTCDTVGNIVNPKDLQLLLNTEKRENTLAAFLIVFVRCDPKYLKPGQSCASDEEIDDFLSKPQNMLTLNIIMQSYDTVNQRINLVQKAYYMAFSPTFPFYSQILFKTTTLKENTGWLFDQITEQKFISNFEINTQNVEPKFTKNLMTIDSFATFLFRLDSIETQTLVTHQNLGQVLAQVGAIVQIIFLLEYLVKYFNEKWVQDSLVSDIISCYYPDFKKIVTQKNLVGQLVKVEKQGKQLRNYEYMILKNELRQKAIKKLSIVNIIYEMSRMQLALQSLLGREQLQSYHRKNWELELPYCDQIMSQDSPQDENVIVYKADYEMHKLAARDKYDTQIEVKQDKYVRNTDIDLLSKLN